MTTRKPVKRTGKNSRRALGRARALRELLQDRRRAAQKELDALSHTLREDHGPETWDEGDRAVSEFNRELGTTRINQLTRQLGQIEEALLRHAEKRFGRCAVCNAEIPLARLQSLPFAIYCRECQEAAEGASAPAVRTRG